MPHSSMGKLQRHNDCRTVFQACNKQTKYHASQQQRQTEGKGCQA